MSEHRIPQHLLENRVRVALIGCGGSGSQMLTGLARLDRAMRALGHPGGIVVTTYDPDMVTPSNVGRQLFAMEDVGLHKAVVLVHRVNLFYGLSWRAVPTRFESDDKILYDSTHPDIVISCVDTALARVVIGQCVEGKGCYSSDYWLDLGNRQKDGQVILGQPRADNLSDRAVLRRGVKPQSDDPPRLPTILEIAPEMADQDEDNTPSCSLAESLERQNLFINDHVSRWALHLLWTLFRRGRIEHHGYWINLQDGRVNPQPVPGKEEVSKNHE